MDLSALWETEADNEDVDTEILDEEVEDEGDELQEDEISKISEKMLSQKQVDELVEKRLARERKKHAEELERLKGEATPAEMKEAEEIVKMMSEKFDNFKGMTPSQMKKEIEAMVGETAEKKPEKTVEEIVDEKLGEKQVEQATKEAVKAFKSLGMSLPEATAVLHDEGFAAFYEKHGDDGSLKDSLVQYWQGEFDKEFEGVDYTALMKDERFRAFAEDKQKTPVAIYKQFVKTLSDVEREAVAKVSKNANRSTSSGKNVSSKGNDYGLTERQKALSVKAGMTYKQYHEYLKQVP